ncbi:MAG TPA: SIMPL domain-containing protein [Stellaceae bacterium]|nr:SIMPL domain-containing protein [Stellaceae bacterium]
MKTRAIPPRAGLVVALGLAVLMPAMPVSAAVGSEASTGTLVTFTENAEQRLVRDRFVADLAVETTNPDPAGLQGEINRRMMAALARAKAVAGVTATTGGYTVYQERPRTGPARWDGRQGLRLEAKDQAALLPLVGTLQGSGLVLTALDATVSREATRAVEDRLTDEALRRVKERAAKVATALGLRVVRIRSLRIGNVAPPPLPMRAMAMSMAAQAVPPPAFAPGEATVNVTVEAEVELGAPP